MSEKSQQTTIRFQAAVARVQTMADGGLRFIFDAPETAVMEAAQLMECKRFGVVLDFTAEPMKDENLGKSKKSYV